MSLKGQFANSSNYTFLVEVNAAGDRFRAVYKPVRGERPLWDFPVRSLARREAAAYLVSEALGWELVPPTVYRKRGPLGAGSVQWFVEHDPERHYFTFSDEAKKRLKPVVLFDMLINNADRKGGHILFDPQEHLWLIDHGVCFHVEDKLRTVIWDFAGQPIPGELLEYLRRFLAALETAAGPLKADLHPLLRPAEIDSLMARARRILDHPFFAQPAPYHRPYP